MRTLGIYIHIPFCRAKCGYCDFYSICGFDDKLLDDYSAAVIKHIKEYAPALIGYNIVSVYFGGGTPTVMGSRRLCGILKAICRAAHIDDNAEITVEANPESADKKLLVKLARAGFNRISFGVQSACDEELALIGRIHNFETAQKAVADARSAGFKNISIDIMFGLPNQTQQILAETLDRIMALNPEHISAYALKLSENVPMYKMRDKLPDDDLIADMYLQIVETLKQNGYNQYEISNFAKYGRKSLHNSRYWSLDEYLGIGAAAHSYLAGKRFSCVADASKYISAVNSGESVMCDVEQIPKNERVGEYIMLSLRTADGIDKDKFERMFSKSFKPCEEVLEKCVSHNLAEKDGNKYVLTPRGFFVSNQIISDILLGMERV